MKRSVWAILVLLIVAAGVAAFLAFWPPSVRMVAMPEDRIPEATRQMIMPHLQEEDSEPCVLRAYGSSTELQFVGYARGSTSHGLFVFERDGQMT